MSLINFILSLCSFLCFEICDKIESPIVKPPRATLLPLSPKSDEAIIDACIIINNVPEYKLTFHTFIQEMKNVEPTRQYIYVEDISNISDLHEKIKVKLPIKGNILVFFYGYGYTDHAFMGSDQISYQTFRNIILRYKDVNANALILSNVFSYGNKLEQLQKSIKISNIIHQPIEKHAINFIHISVAINKNKKDLLPLILTEKISFAQKQTDVDIYSNILENVERVSYHFNGLGMNIPRLINPLVKDKPHLIKPQYRVLSTHSGPYNL